MTTTDTPVYNAMLELAGYASESDLWDAVRDKTLEPGQARLMRHLLGAFNALKSAESDLIFALERLQILTAEQIALAAKGDYADPTRLAAPLGKVAKANAKVTELRERIPELLWVVTGEIPGRD